MNVYNLTPADLESIAEILNMKFEDDYGVDLESIKGSISLDWLEMYLLHKDWGDWARLSRDCFPKKRIKQLQERIRENEEEYRNHANRYDIWNVHYNNEVKDYGSAFDTTIMMRRYHQRDMDRYLTRIIDLEAEIKELQFELENQD